MANKSRCNGACVWGCLGIVSAIFLGLAIAATVCGAVWYHRNVTSNKNLKGECMFTRIDKDHCTVSCWYNTTTVVPSEQVSCSHDTYRLRIVKDADGNVKYIPTSLLATGGFMALLIIGAVILGGYVVAGLSFLCFAVICCSCFDDCTDGDVEGTAEVVFELGEAMTDRG